MSKLWALYINEMIKISRKVSSIVLISIMTVGIIGIGTVIRLGAFSGKSSAGIAQEALIALNRISSQGMLGFGLFIIIILMFILAGSSVSGEMATGSIKSLIISPVKRWKIFTAKVCSLLTVGILATLFLYSITVLMNGILFGFNAGAPYTYVLNSVSYSMDFYLYQFFNIFLNFIDVIVYMSFALMLSVITRNTAASVGISIAVYFGGGIASTFIRLFAHGEWTKFIPFNNLSFAARIFGNLSFSGAMISGIDLSQNIPVSFSLCYIAVIVICMIYTALDSFNRRDIK